MKNTITRAFALLALAASLASLGGTPAKTYTWRQLLDAIRVVETGGEPNDGIGAVGDGGRALGPYQIWSAYHTDAAGRDKTLSSHASCKDSKSYSERVVRAYMDRYSRAELLRLEGGTGSLADCERVARIHNGGPRGYRKQATEAYWIKIKARL